MLSRAEWTAAAHRYVAEAEKLIANTGWPAKRATIVHDFSVNCPIWIGTSGSEGEIRINPDRDEPESVAHEFGHGVHEAMRSLPAYSRKLTDKAANGEEFAQMVRYEVDRRLGGKWVPNQDRRMYQQCNGDWSAFKVWVES